MTSLISSTLINLNRTNYDDPTLILGPQKRGILDTFSGHHPKLKRLQEQLQAQDWRENEFPHNQSKLDFRVCSPDQYDKMVATLAWQWETDTVVSSISALMSPFVTADILDRLYGRIADNEKIHAASYSEIVINSFDDPTAVIADILGRQAAQERLRYSAEVYTELEEASLAFRMGKIPNNQELYNLVIRFLFSNYLTESTGFGTSFVYPFHQANQGRFNSVGHTLQKIAIDELTIHAPVGAYVLNTELGSERGLVCYNSLRDWFTKSLRQCLDSEYAWNAANFSGKTMDSDLSENRLNRYARYLATKAMREIRLPVPEDIYEPTNPLPFMDKWLGERQTSPQEERSGLYLLGNFIGDHSVDLINKKYLNL